MAERGRFELPVLFRYSRFPGVRVKPLCHLSNREDMSHECPSGASSFVDAAAHSEELPWGKKTGSWKAPWRECQSMQTEANWTVSAVGPESKILYVPWRGNVVEKNKYGLPQDYHH